MISKLWHKRYLLRTMIKRELLIRYRGSAMGLAWIFGAPILMMLTYTAFVLGVVNTGRGSDSHSLSSLGTMWVAMGLWQWLTESTNRSTTAFHDNAQLVKRTPIPLALLPLSNILVSAIGFTFPFLACLALMTFEGEPLKAYVSLILGILAFLPWIIVSCFFMSIAGTFLRDAKHAVPVFLSIGLLLSPILYRIDQIPSSFRSLLYLNPFTESLNLIRTSSSDAGPMSIGVIVSTVVSITLAFASIKYFYMKKGEFYDVV